MDIKENETQTNLPARRKFVKTMGVLSAFAAIGSFAGLSFWRKKKPVATKNQTVKMLTQDGRLVEVDVARLNGNMKKVSNTDLQHWIKK
jgi:hypothetical protein